MKKDYESLTSLLEKAKAGDRAAQDRLASLSRNFIKQLSERSIGEKLGRRMDSSDLVQETQLEVFRDLVRIKAKDTRGFFAFVKSVYDMTFLAKLRHGMRGKRNIAAEVQVDATVAEELEIADKDPAQAEMEQLCLDALEVLNKNERHAIWRKHVEGATIAQLVEELELGPKAVLGLLKRAREKLRLHLQDALSGTLPHDD
jgi:RNA polymerase sigma factor (sigma-70 family)